MTTLSRSQWSAPDRAAAPHYPVAAIDNTLRTLRLLETVGEVRVVDVANHLEVARSTAHRILTMLTYFGFAEQDEAKHYRLPNGPIASHPRRDLLAAAHPSLVRLAAVTGNTAHVVVLEGNGVRFLHGVEPRTGEVLRVRDGVLYPAHLTAGGRALLAQLSEPELRRLFPSRIGIGGLRAVDHRVIADVLERTRRRGYAVNEGENQAGVNAVGRCVRDRSGAPVAALVVAGTSAQLPRSAFPGAAAALADAVRMDLPVG